GGARPRPAAWLRRGSPLYRHDRRAAAAARRRRRDGGGPVVSDAGPADIFAELLALATPDRLLLDPRANGENVRVCVIDSGVESELLAARCRQRGQECHPIEGGVFSASQAEPLAFDGHQS